MIRLPAAAGLALCAAALLLSGCSLPTPPPPAGQGAPAEPARPGKYYKDDGPPDFDEVDWRTVAEPQPVFEPINPGRNRPYEVFGVRYVPFAEYTAYREQGMASWYGRRYHGRLTSSGETYDMYGMSAAHTVLPIPSYVRVTRVDDGRSIVVRVNDRGPFLNNRIIDLSYTAARRLGIVATGTGEVIVEAILPPDVVPARRPVPVPEPVPQPVDPGSELQVRPGHYLQLGAFSVRENARRLIDKAPLPGTMRLQDLQMIERGGLYKVVAGPYASEGEAKDDLRLLRSAGMEAVPVELE